MILCWLCLWYDSVLCLWYDSVLCLWYDSVLCLWYDSAGCVCGRILCCVCGMILCCVCGMILCLLCLWYDSVLVVFVKQAALIRQLEEELRLSHMRNPDAEVQQHLEALYNEKEHMTKEIFLLRETIKVAFLLNFTCIA
ncbi:hypothetical protein CEXT_151331 [Caerostris extrusa]|uniref:Uncharacterized protein n=1 Tax=Caerostris extrusa TaxID=172846 RepID=A0AAV4S4D5_CAEEX|nr:hypothetical protein CEXT_151331 [Caerostris extrusa]